MTIVLARSTTRTVALACALALASSAGPLASAAHAHPIVDEGVELLGRARFEEALERFDRAASGDELDVEALVQLLEGRALAHRALGDEDAMTLDLRRLAAIRPDHAFAEHVPPEVAWRFRVLRDRHPGRLRVRVSIAVHDGRARIGAALDGDPGGLVTAVRIGASAGGGAWQWGEGDALEVDAPAATPIAYAVSVIGIGGAVLVEQGSEEAPLPAIVLPEPAGAPCDASGGGGDGGGGGVDVLPWILAGGALVLGAVGVGLAIALSPPPESTLTMPTPPTRATP